MGILTETLDQYPEIYHYAVIGCFCVLLYRYVIYPIYFHPLAAIPGPTLARLTKYYILYKTWNQERNCLVHDLHEKYGTIVRVGPDEIDISDIGYQKDIYMNNFDKTQFYGQFGIYGKLNTFSSLTRLPHQKSRKLSNKFYSKSSVTSPGIQEMVRDYVSTTIRLCDEKSSQHNAEPLNVYDLFQMMAMDVVASFSFGTKVYKSLLANYSNYGPEVIENFRLRSSGQFWTTLLPQWKKYVTSDEQKLAGAYGNNWIYKNTMAALEKDGEAETLATVLLQGGKDETSIAAEIGDHVAAGYQTTGITLSYCIWKISEHPQVQMKLQEEVAFLRNIYNGHTAPSYQEVDDLPYLNAILNETFRLYAAIPGQEPRLVPKSGMMWKGNKQTPQVMIPAGTIVNMQPWTLHRDSSIFEDPEVWNPERWLIKDEEKLKIMNKQLMTFGAGIRMCLGMHLATEEMKLLITGLYSRFSTRLDENFDYDYNMHVEDLWTTHPRGHKCNIRFYPLEH